MFVSTSWSSITYIYIIGLMLSLCSYVRICNVMQHSYHLYRTALNIYFFIVLMKWVDLTMYGTDPYIHYIQMLHACRIQYIYNLSCVSTTDSELCSLCEPDTEIR